MADDDNPSKQITDQLAAACMHERCMGQAAIEDMLTRLALQPDAGLAKQEDDKIVLYVIAKGLLFEVRSECKPAPDRLHDAKTVRCYLRSVPASDDASFEYRTELREDDKRTSKTIKTELRFTLGKHEVKVGMGVPDDPDAADHFALTLLAQVFAPRTRRANGKATAA